MKGLKKLRRLFALLMAMIMVMGTCITTQAADTGSITITNAADGETYSIYKLFDVTYNGSDDVYTYTVADGWEYFFSSGDGADYVDVDTLGHVTWINSADEEKLAKIAIDYAQDSNNGISAVDSDEATDEPLTFENLEYGYYLVNSSLGAICSLTTAYPNVEITEKNGTPTVKKEVKEGNYFEETNTAEIGDTVYFTTTMKNVSNVRNLVLHDKMSSGLTLNESSILITLDRELNGEVEVDSKYYEVISGTESLADGCTFEIEFTDDFTELLETSTVIYVEYSAEVNSGAEIGGDGNPNETYVTYGENGTSKEDITTTYVYDLYIYKYDGETGQPLEGAKFVLSTEEGGAVLDENNKLNGWTADGSKVTQIESNSEGVAKIEGLDAGTYYLEEWEAPAGYNTVKENIYITITETGKLQVNGEDVNYTIEVDEKTHYAVKIANNTGGEMPSTGGIGTTIFYVVGGIMTLGAAVVLITRRRMHES